MQRAVGMVFGDLLRRMESIVGDHPANGLDGTAMVITILAVNGSDAMDEGHMALSAPAVV
jgi:hypothetical protein